MTEYIISLTLLIAAVVLIRTVFRKKIAPRMMYALWLVVLVRMLLPFPLFRVTLPETVAKPTPIDPIEPIIEDTTPVPNGFTSDFVVQEQTETVQNVGYSDTFVPHESVVEPSGTTPSEIVVEPETEASDEVFIGTVDTIPKVTEPTSLLSVNNVLNIVWAVGAAVVFLWFTVSGAVFSHGLKKDRQLHSVVGKTKIYLSSGAGSPCVSGIIPVIYINPEAAENSDVGYIVKHEMTHISHGDNIWAIFRILALVAFWYNPAVWLAAFLSKRDAELAVDDSIAARLNEGERIEYARAILAAVPVKRGFVSGFGSAPLKERIIMLTKKRKSSLLVSIIALLLIFPCVFGSFVGFVYAGSEKNSSEPFVDVTEGAYYHDAVLWAYRNGIVSGTTETEFSPDETCTRAELVTCLWRMAGEPEPPSKRNRFTDVYESDYYYKAVLWAAKIGITRGTGSGHFSPSNKCTYGDVLTMIWRAEGSHWNRGLTEWYEDAVNWAEMMNLSYGISGNGFISDKLCPRKDVVTLMYRALKMNSVEEWMKEYKGRTLGDLYDSGEIYYYAGTNEYGNCYLMTDFFGIYVITDGKENDSKIVGAQFFGSNWVTNTGISPLMKGVHANQNFNSWDKTEASIDADGEFYTYYTDEEGYSMKAVWQVSSDIYYRWYQNNGNLRIDEKRASYNELVKSNQYSAVGYVYTYYMTFSDKTETD